MPRHKKKQRGRKGRRNRNGLTHYRPQGLGSSTILPPEAHVWLKFVDCISLLNAGASNATRRFKPTASYDVDPTLGSTSTAGFAEMAAVFQYYRVERYRYVIRVANRETFPLQVVVMDSNTDPGTGVITPFIGNANTKFKMISGTQGGPNMCSFRGKHTVAQIVGSSEVEFDDNFASLTNTVPVNVVWTTVGIDSGIGANTLNNGALVTIEIWMHVRFYERKNLST